MDYVDLRPRVKKKIEELIESSSTDSAPASGDFFSNFAEVGKNEQSIVTNKDDMMDLLNLLNEKLSTVEEKLYRIERKLEERERRY